VGDFNGDGKQDLAVANQLSDNVSILLGNGNGTFGAATNFSAGDAPFSVAVGDFNGDGRPDLAVVNLSDNLSVLLNTTAFPISGAFGMATNFAAGNGPQSVAVADFDRDGKQDLAVANLNSNDISILLGTGSATFGAATGFAAGSGPHFIAVGDFNRDGIQDVALVNFFSDNVSILLGTGNGNFGAPTNFVAGTNPQSLAVGDFNGDGRQDLAVANLNSDNVSILWATAMGPSARRRILPRGMGR
jgi:hypothetical protein